MAECAVSVRRPAQAWSAPGGICWRALAGEKVRGAVAGADRPLLARRAATVMMGDIGEEITEVELEPLPEEMPEDMPAAAPAEPAAEPVPG